MNRVQCRGGCGRLVIAGQDGDICRKCRREVKRGERKAKQRVRRQRVLPTVEEP